MVCNAIYSLSNLFRLEALLEHCVEAFRRGLKVDTAVEELVWAHLVGPAEARTVATEYFVRNCRRIQVGSMCDCALCLMCVEGLVLACSTKNSRPVLVRGSRRVR